MALQTMGHPVTVSQISSGPRQRRMASDRTLEFQLDYARQGSSMSSTGTSSGVANNSKASSPTEATKVDWQFLNFTHPSEAKTSQHRKKVRSHVTRQQHQREHALSAARRARSNQPDNQREKTSAQPRTESPFPSLHPSSAGQLEELQSKPGSPVDVSQSPSPMPSPTTTTPPSQIDPADVYPPGWQDCIPQIMDHYLSSIIIDIPGLSETDATGLFRARYFPFLLTDPAPLHAITLVAASFYAKVRGSRSLPIDLLQLRGMAIREINGALANDVRGTSDQIIAAVAQIASYEALFGDRGICNTHMQGLTRMVSLRGGLPALGLDGLLERIVLWVDSNVSHIMNRHLYFDPRAFPPSGQHVMHPTPNTSCFAAGGLARRTTG